VLPRQPGEGVSFNATPQPANLYPARSPDWAKGNPNIPFCFLKDGRFLSAQLIDRNRKGALGVASG
jgi:hypothetical protein